MVAPSGLVFVAAPFGQPNAEAAKTTQKPQKKAKSKWISNSFFLDFFFAASA
jgi:hypothetical protein